MRRHVWGVNGDSGRFPETDTVGDNFTDIPGAIGYLLEQTGEIDGIGNRTTVLFYTPGVNASSGDVSVRCAGGGGSCFHFTHFIGIVYCTYVLHTYIHTYMFIHTYIHYVHIIHSCPQVLICVDKL